MLAWFIRDGLEWAGVSGDMSYLGSVIVGYLGMNFLGGQLRRRIDPTVPDRDNP
ncbi:Phage holin family (Lysis protein S) [compost metagenome]